MTDRTDLALARLRAKGWGAETRTAWGTEAGTIEAILLDCAEALAALYEEAWGDMTAPPGREGEIHTRLSFGLLSDVHACFARLADVVVGKENGDAR